MNSEEGVPREAANRRKKHEAEAENCAHTKEKSGRDCGAGEEGTGRGREYSDARVACTQWQRMWKRHAGWRVRTEQLDDLVPLVDVVRAGKEDLAADHLRAGTRDAMRRAHTST